MSQTAETSLYGGWRLDREKTIAELIPRAAADEGVKVLLEEVASPEFDLRIHFQPDGVAVVSEGSDLPETMRWRTSKERSPREIEIELFQKDRKVQDARVEFVAKGALRLNLLGMEAPLVLKKIEAR